MQVIEDLDVFKISYNLVLKIYKATRNFPKEELYGLSSQMRRAAVSITSNLSEGGARTSDAEKRHFISIARGSSAELKCQISIAKDLGFIEIDTANDLMDDIVRVKKMLTGLLRN
ncbi:MAG: four helix bundle protein [Rickettsiales bacterium]|jgi:four helix bundle protein|nr:four helix bundle protein [Rickettsiales bacterium]